jgi:F420-non-reducing hydrogenase iron-sulfur subunit
MKYVAELLDQVGLGGGRVAMVNLSSAMGAQFAQTVTEMTEKVREWGPNPLHEAHNRNTNGGHDDCR